MTYMLDVHKHKAPFSLLDAVKRDIRGLEIHSSTLHPASFFLIIADCYSNRVSPELFKNGPVYEYSFNTL